MGRVGLEAAAIGITGSILFALAGGAAVSGQVANKSPTTIRTAGNPSAATTRIIVEPNVLVSTDGDVPHVETALAVNPRDSKNLIGCAIVYGSQRTMTCKTYASKDGGNTWLDHAFAERADYISADPQIAFGPDGTAYFLMMSIGKGRSVNHFFTSADGGMTWQRMADAPGKLADYVQMAVNITSGKYVGRIYITAKRADGHGVYSTSSSDDGRTFSPPIALPGIPPAALVHNFRPLVFHDGSLFVLFRTWPESADSDPLTYTLVAVSSHDGGVSFSEPVEILKYSLAPREIRDKTFRLVAGGVHEAVALDPRPDGERVYLAWVDSRPEGHRVVVRHSSDHGKTWSPTRMVAPVERGEQYQPEIAVSGDGVLGVTWFDTRAFPNLDGYDVYFTASADGGESFFPARKVSSASSRPHGHGNLTPGVPYQRRTDKGLIGYFQAAYARYASAGEYIGLASNADRVFHCFWPDSRTGTFQIQTARIHVAPTEQEATRLLLEPEGLAVQPIKDKVAIQSDPAHYDEVKKEGELFVRLRNVSQDRIYAPLVAKIAEVEGCELIDGGKGARGAGLDFNFTSALGDLPYLPPGCGTEPIRLRFRPVPNSDTCFPILTLTVTARTEISSKRAK
jgi:hypothetical protein